jgi:putative membrane protein
MSVQHDQQLAGAIMKTGGGIFLWTIIIYLFFARFAAGYQAANDDSYRRPHPIPGAELTGDSDTDSGRPLTTGDVEREFARVPAAREDRS